MKTINRYNIAEAPADKVVFLLLDVTYYPAFLEVKKRTKWIESFSSYIDKKDNLLSEYMEEEDKLKKADFGFKYFSNQQKFLKYKKDIQSVIVQVNSYKKAFDKIDLESINLKQILDLFEKGKSIYHEALGLYLVSQPEYTVSIEKKTKDALLKFVPGNKLEEVFITLITSKDKSCLEQERFDWLLNIVLPTIKSHKNISDVKKDEKILKNIDKHIDKYKYYSAGIEFDLRDREHYLKLLKDDLKSGAPKLNKEFLDIKNKDKTIKKEKDKIIKKYRIPLKLIQITKIVSDLSLLRINLRVLGWQFFNYSFPLFINSSAKKLKIKPEIIGDMDYSDYVKLLKGKLSPNKSKDRNNRNILIMISNKGGYEKFRGVDADKKFNKDIKQKVNKVQEFKGTVAHRQGIVTGKVFLFKRGAKDFNKRIYEFPKDYILVAGQTKPLLMPAIRKAKAIVTDEGGLLCHAAIVSRELKIPCIIGTKVATKLLEDDDLVEVDTNTGTIKILKKNK